MVYSHKVYIGYFAYLFLTEKVKAEENKGRKRMKNEKATICGEIEN